MPITETLNVCRNNAVLQGFKDTFSVTPRGLYSLHTSRYFRPEQVTVLQKMQIDGNTNASDNATLYVIETADGIKGTLTEPMCASADPGIPKFFGEVECICRQMSQYGRHHC